MSSLSVNPSPYGEDPYGTKNPSSAPPLDLSSPFIENLLKQRELANSSAVQMYGVGDVQVQPSGTETSYEVQEIWNEQIAIIADVIGKVNAGTAEPEDLDRLVKALQELEKLATEGVTDENGQTFYLTQDMATALNVLLYEFAKVGITPDLNTSTMSNEQKMTILSQAAAPAGTDPADDPLQVAIMNAQKLEYENLGFQSYIYAQLMGVINSTATDLENLEEFITQCNQVLALIDDLVEISTYTNPPEPWVIDLTFDDPGDIPPDAVGEIADYMRADGEEDLADEFEAMYEKELAIATANAEKNGTTVQEEMAKTPSPNSSDLLREYIGEEGDEERITAITEIVLDAAVQELESIPTAPEGMTMTEVADDIYQTKLAMEEQIKVLNENGSTELAAALQDVVDTIDQAWEDAVAGTSYAGTSYEQVKADADAGNAEAIEVMEKFATNYIYAVQPGTTGANDLNAATTQFTSWSEELNKDLQKLVTLLEALVKCLSSMLKMADDVNDAYVKNMA